METTLNRISKQVTFERGLFVVLIPPGDSIQRYHSYHPSGDHHQEYISFFLEELLPSVRLDLHLKGMCIHKIGLLGDSLGGSVSLSLICKEPAQFTHVLMQSAALSEENFTQLQSVKCLEDVRIYQAVGRHEDEFISPISNQQLYILTTNRKMRIRLEDKGAMVTYYEEDEHHLWDFWRRDLLRTLNYFLQN